LIKPKVQYQNFKLLPMLQETSLQPMYVRHNELNSTNSLKNVLRISKSNRFIQESLDVINFSEISVENFVRARFELSLLLENGNLPAAILIDVPYSRISIIAFSNWLKSSTQLKKIPVLYNYGVLTDADIKELKALDLVDDILNIETNLGILPAKCEFITRAKSSQRNKPMFKVISAQQVSTKMTTQVDSFFRRAFDIFISLLLITLLLPLFVIIAIAIKLESKGPVFYNSLRAGKGYKIFKFYKFRTMQADAEKKREQLDQLNLYNNQNSGAQFFKIKNDPRITRLGAFLRNTSLDEIPQLFNVLKGDMSIVGNRPLPLYEAVTLTTDDWAERFMAPAGITGLWQIEKRGKEDMSVMERINLDISYAKSNDFIKDLRILVRTPTAMFQKANV
jgi:lipopolysaccharide/colanic/teichoic acid biosynthesis glycosyltransferase